MVETCVAVGRNLAPDPDPDFDLKRVLSDLFGWRDRRPLPNRRPGARRIEVAETLQLNDPDPDDLEFVRSVDSNAIPLIEPIP